MEDEGRAAGPRPADLPVEPLLLPAADQGRLAARQVVEKAKGLLMADRGITKCDAFRWLQRKCRLSLGKAGSGQGRNFARITFMETIYVTWFCYGFSLFLGDARFLGYDHWATYVIVALLAVWSLYLVWKLSKFSRVMAAIRFAIPTKAIFWIPFGEFAPKYGFYEDIWLKPQEYTWEMWGLFVLFIVLICATAFFPQRKGKSG